MSHRLHLGAEVKAENLLAFLSNRFPQASQAGDEITLTDNSSVRFDPLSDEWEVTVPTRREDVAHPAEDPYGLAAAFPEGQPVGEEADVLRALLAVVRRLGGSLITDTGHELSAHQFMLPDLRVVSPYALSAEQALEVVQDIVRESRVDGSEQQSAAGLPYAIVMPIFPDADLRVRVEKYADDLPALAHVQWVKDAAVNYVVQFEPHGECGSFSHNDPAQVKKWREAYLGCSAIAKSMHQVVGGFVVDPEGFLIDPDDLM